MERELILSALWMERGQEELILDVYWMEKRRQKASFGSQMDGTNTERTYVRQGELVNQEPFKMERCSCHIEKLKRIII